MRQFLLLLSGILFLSCGVSDDHARIEGSFSNIKQAEFYIYSEDGTFEGMDTLRVEDGKFSYDRPLTKKTVLTLLFPNFAELYLIAEPGKTIKVSGDAGQLEATDISGTDENELLTKFRLQNLNKSASELKMAANQFIRDNAATQAAFAVFRQHFAKAENPDPDVTIGLLDALKKAQPDNLALKSLDTRLRPLLLHTSGKSLPDFEALTLESGKVRKADFSGRPLLIVFFAGWNNEGRQMMEEVRRLQRAYGKRLGLLLVSLDVEEKRCRKYLETDSLLSVPVAFDGKAFESPLVKQLGVRYLPGNLLANQTGHIIARDLPAEELHNRVVNLMN